MMALKPEVLEVKLGQRRIKVGDIGAIIASLPEKTRGPAVRHLAEFYVRKFRLYPRYKAITRRRAYPNAPAGPGWFSEKQRRYVMARIREGTIQPGVSHRTMATKNAWKVTGAGATLTIRNELPHAGWLYSDRYQARQPALVGWETISKMQENYSDEAFADLVDFIDKEIVRIFK